jgi:cytochrome c553
MRQKSKWIASFGLFAAVTGIAFAASVGMPERQAKTLIASCAACHGSKGEGLEARSAPRLAGLDPTFMEGQLTHFAKGLRGTHPGDTFGSQMQVIALCTSSVFYDPHIKRPIATRQTGL